MRLKMMCILSSVENSEGEELMSSPVRQGELYVPTPNDKLNEK